MLFKWVKGRQEDCEYKKFKLWSFKIWKWGFDAYILKYKSNTILNWHTGPVKDGKHWRLNIKLKGISLFMLYKGVYKSYLNRIVIFRPDLYEHSLMVTTNTTKLSFGFVKFD